MNLNNKKIFKTIEKYFVIIMNCIKKEKKILFIILAITTFFLPILLYCCQFGKFPFSSDTQDWANFGDYIGGAYSVITSLFATYVAYIVYKNSNRNEKMKSCIYKMIESHERIQAHYTSYNGNNNQEVKNMIITECIIMDYYVKALPENYCNSEKLRNAIYEVRVQPTSGAKFDYLRQLFEDFIKNLPWK